MALFLNNLDIWGIIDFQNVYRKSFIQTNMKLDMGLLVSEHTTGSFVYARLI